MVAQAVHGHVSKATMFPEKIYHPLVAGMFFGLSISAGCASWESMAREGDLGGACRAIDDIENPRRQADARAQVSRDYTQESDADARIRMLTSTALENPEVFDASRYQVVEVQSNVRIEPRALVRGDALWLVVDDAVHGQALIDSVGMRVSERSAPVSQSMSEAADRYVLELSRGLVDSSLRKREFGTLAVCKPEVGECAERRRALAQLAQRFAEAEECDSGDCSRVVLLKRSEELAEEERLRVEVQWNFEGCALSHFTDVKLEAGDEVEVGTRVLSEPWSRVDETLDDCTRQEFLPTRCRAGIQRQPE